MSSLAGTRNTANEGPTRGRTILQPISSNIPRIGTGHVPIIKSTSRLGTNNKPTVSASSIAGTTTTAKSTIVPEIKLQLPVPLGDDNDFISENDEEEDQHLMAILQKLKQVQTTTTESKQRKRAREVIDESCGNYAKEVKSLITKHNRKWDAKHAQIIDRQQHLKESLQDLLKEVEQDHLETQDAVNKTQGKLEQVQKLLDQTEKAIDEARGEWDRIEDENVQAIKDQIENYMAEVKRAFIETQRKALKDDKLSRLIKTFLATF